MNAGTSFGTSIFLNAEVLRAVSVRLGIYLIRTEAYLIMISFLVDSSKISEIFYRARSKFCLFI